MSPAARFTSAKARRTRAGEGGGRRLVEVEADAAGDEQAAPEPVAADLGERVQEVGAQRAAVRRGRQVPDVARERAEVADVVREPLELEGDAAQRERARRRLPAGERLDRLHVGEGVAHRGVARDRLGERERAPVRAAAQQPLDPAVLVPEDDLEVEHLLAVALEAEVAGLDDAGVHRADRDLVHLLALHREERVLAGDRRRGGGAAEGVRAGAARRLEAERLRPRVPLGHDAELLGDLALEGLRRGRHGGERGEGAPDEGGEQAELPLGIVGEDGGEEGALALGAPEERHEAPAGAQHADHRLAEALHRQHRHRAGVHRLAVPGVEHVRAEVGRLHDHLAHGASQPPPTRPAAAPKRSFRPCGR